MNKKRLVYVLAALLTIGTLLSSSVASATTKSDKVLSLKHNSLTIYVGDSKTLGVSKNTTGFKATFKSSTTSVATVTSKGVIKAIKAGKTTITVEAGTKVAKCVVTVKNKELKLKNSSLTIYTGDSKTLGIYTNTTGSKANFKSSNTSIVTVNSNGVLKAKKKGTTVITVTAGSKSATCKVTVKNKVIEPQKIIVEDYICIDQKHTYELEVTVVPINATNKKVTYKSSDTSIVSVDSNTGAFIGHQEGIAFITATATNGIKAVCEVEVTDSDYIGDYVEETPKEKDSTLYIKQGSVNLGQSISKLQITLGAPNRIDENEYGGQTYVYNSDYTSLLFIYVEEGEVVGYYTNAASFECAGVTNNLTLDEVEEISLGNAIWTVPDKYTVKIWYDSEGTWRPMALFLTNTSMDQEWGAEEYLQNPSTSLVNTMNLGVIDLINGFRGREGISAVSLSTTAQSVARAHSKDMLTRLYVEHISPEGITPHQRLINAGISCSASGEIIALCAPSGIVYDFSGFMVSTVHRSIILDSSMQYVGSGLVYGKHNDSGGVITVNFYR